MEERNKKHRHHHRSSWSYVRHFFDGVFQNLSQVPLGLTLLTIGIMPIIYSGGPRWWLPSVQLMLLVAVAVHFLVWWWQGKRNMHLHFPAPCWIAALPMLWGFLQLVPLGRLSSWLSVSGALAKAKFVSTGLGIPSTALSLATDFTFQRCSVAFACFLLAFLLVNVIRTTKQLKLVLGAVMVAALGNSLLSLYNLMLKPGKDVEILEISGAFLNSNHFAFMIIMGTLATFGLMALCASERHAEHEDDGPRGLNRPSNIALIIIIFVMIASIVLSTSRGGFLGFMVAVVLFFGVWIFHSRRMIQKNRQRILAMTMLVAIAVAYALPAATMRLARHYNMQEDGQITMDQRVGFWKTTMPMVKDYWLTGSGLGTYGSVIENYQPRHKIHRPLEHAHNDYLELVAEAGVPFAVIFLGSIACLCLVCLKRLQAEKDDDAVRDAAQEAKNSADRPEKIETEDGVLPEDLKPIRDIESGHHHHHHRHGEHGVRPHHHPPRRWAAYAALAAIVGCAVHEFVDFNLLAWSNTMVFTTLVCVAYLASRHFNDDHIQEDYHIHRTGRWFLRLPLLFSGLLVLAVVPTWGLTRLKGAYYHSLLLDDISTVNELLPPGKDDFRRRVNLARKAEKCLFSTDHLLYQRMAAAYFSWANVEPDMAKVLLPEAHQAIVKAASIAPTDGFTLLYLAAILDREDAMGIRPCSIDELLAYYRSAREHQPNLPNTANALVNATVRLVRRKLGGRIPETLRQQALQDVRFLVEMVPERATHIMPIIVALEPSPDKLLEIIPNLTEAHHALLQQLLLRRRYPQALKLADTLLANLDLSKPGTIKGNENLKLRYNVLRLKACMLELTGQLEARDKLWPEIEQAAEDRIPWRLINRSIERNDLRGADSRIQTYLGKVPFFPYALVIQQAKLYAQLGKSFDMVHALQRLVYQPDNPPSPELIDEALTLLKMADSFPDNLLPRAKFLEAVLKMFKKQASGDLSGLNELILAMEQAEGPLTTGRSSVWMQKHLVSYYIGRGYLLTGFKQAAVQAFLRSLSLCPDNVFTIGELMKISPDSLEPADRELWKFYSQRKTPISQLTANIACVGVKCEPEVVRSITDTVDFTMLLMCIGDVTTKFTRTLHFRDARGDIMHPAMSFKEGEEYTWRVGQLIEFTRKYQPVGECFKQYRRQPHNGPVILNNSIASFSFEL